MVKESNTTNTKMAIDFKVLWLETPQIFTYQTKKVPIGKINTIDSQTGILCRNTVQYAFKDLMIHGILQFTLRIAFRCVLHRCESQEIRCQKLFFIFQ